MKSSVFVTVFLIPPRTSIVLWQGPGNVTASVRRGKRGDMVNINQSCGEQASSQGVHLSSSWLLHSQSTLKLFRLHVRAYLERCLPAFHRPWHV